MVDVPVSLRVRIDFPVGAWYPTITGASPAIIYRAWAGEYASQQGFTFSTGSVNGITTYNNNVVNDAFRHNFVSAALYLDAYSRAIASGSSADLPDRQASFSVLSQGSFNEWWAPNPLQGHLKDYWNNYNGVLIGRRVLSETGVDISNGDLANVVAVEVSISLIGPIGAGSIIIFRDGGRDAFGNLVNEVDPRLAIGNYDLDRLPNAGWLPTDGGLNWYVVPSSVRDFMIASGRTGVLSAPQCFGSETAISILNGSSRKIDRIILGDDVLAFSDRSAAGTLHPARVTRILHGVTTEWIVLDDGTRVTPGHHYLRPDGGFMAISDILALDGMVVDAAGSPKRVTGTLLRATDAGSDAMSTPE